MKTSLAPAALLIAAALAPTGVAASRQALGHAAIAREWARRHQVAVVAGGPEVVQAAMEQAFARIPLGAFDLRIPVGVEYDRHEVADLTVALGVLLETQELWLSWSNGDGRAASPREWEPGRKAFLDLAASLSPKALASPSAAGAGLIAALASPEARTRLEHLDHALHRAIVGVAALPPPGDLDGTLGPRQGVEEEPALAAPARKTLVLCPSRAEFVDFACYVGLIREELQGIYWQQSLSVWNEFDFDGVRVSPLRYAESAQRDYTVGTPMKGRSGEGLSHHVMQLGLRGLQELLYGTRIDPMLAGGIASSLVIERYGRIETRTDGDLRSGSTQGRSVFIPASLGGQSQGGTLPPQLAGSRWSRELGKGHYRRQLQNALKNGGKLVKEREQKRRSFELLHEDEVQRYPVLAPFLHPSTAARVVPSGYAADFADFLRAYRTAFGQFLRVEAVGKESPGRFAAFLQALRADPELDVFTAIERSYGLPLSSELPGDGDLEGRFLASLR